MCGVMRVIVDMNIKTPAIAYSIVIALLVIGGVSVLYIILSYFVTSLSNVIMPTYSNAFDTSTYTTITTIWKWLPFFAIFAIGIYLFNEAQKRKPGDEA